MSFLGVPQPGQDGGGVPQPGQDWGGTPVLGWGTPHPGQDGGIPQPGQDRRDHMMGYPLDRTTEGVLATRRAVCLLHSRRRTFLLQINRQMIKLKSWYFIRHN